MIDDITAGATCGAQPNTQSVKRTTRYLNLRTGDVVEEIATGVKYVAVTDGVLYDPIDEVVIYAHLVDEQEFRHRPDACVTIVDLTREVEVVAAQMENIFTSSVFDREHYGSR